MKKPSEDGNNFSRNNNQNAFSKNNNSSMMNLNNTNNTVNSKSDNSVNNKNPLVEKLNKESFLQLNINSDRTDDATPRKV